MEIRDYNEPGEWSADALRRRYLEHAKRLGLKQVRELESFEHEEGEVRWIYPLMDDVIAGMETGEPARIEIGVEFVESGHQQPFGKRLHSNSARALRRSILTSEQVDRLRRRILGMLVDGQAPYEFKQYAKLLRRIGLGEGWEDAKTKVDRSNPYVMRHVRYFEACAERKT